MLRSLYYLKAMGFDFINTYTNYRGQVHNFEELKKNIQTCTLCHFSKTRKFSLIEQKMKKVKLLIVDTHSQKSENESGILLDSKKGEKLKYYIHKNLGLSNEDFYFSYLFKCFSNGKFDDFSLQSCLPFFWNELKLIQPSFLLCLGEYAFKSLGFKDFDILRGEIFTYKNFFIMPSYELNFIEKNPSYEKIFIQDLNKIKGFL
ncbi:uracil-DNA glycosylase family protein [Campylobacter hepaticus]|uniref:uracil-DNA glycosylase family protein n=1 Tax=Campylobacter hepaticus TaxID=1813019 RepID=UPI0029A24DAF|nr:uracil-DNA glycosylase family protein [Campylobacter hepaticus]MDX2322947.1 uracil-DNA glycosylase family protein [Campylobacter hepaticus]MDX2330504.1 uracil-DNA glycosylase family protein [Campylobacter hepaticus]MDX2332047.1 uracil-DNA glycosylase family protein [Campylobacter hepaticus]MDX2371121.1 uracil-DNA glycosylase family protein [Campylobacter hepaticus]MDX2397533.1 uracil-DNA glycosylase family protein [Campylobacter hepaticus]